MTCQVALSMGSGRRLSLGLPVDERLGIARGSRKTGRRTKDAPGAPARRHGKRTLADAPFGARLQGTVFPTKNLADFPETASRRSRVNSNCRANSAQRGSLHSV